MMSLTVLSGTGSGRNLRQLMRDKRASATNMQISPRRLNEREARTSQRLACVLDEIEADIVISLGLWPGEGDIRFERIALNIMDFAMAHNNGERLLHPPSVPKLQLYLR
jgi:pyrrolidone-carboxylate peptidase